MLCELKKHYKTLEVSNHFKYFNQYFKLEDLEAIFSETSEG